MVDFKKKNSNKVKKKKKKGPKRKKKTDMLDKGTLCRLATGPKQFT